MGFVATQKNGIRAINTTLAGISTIFGILGEKFAVTEVVRK